MATFKIEVDLNWIHDGDVDSAVKEVIIDGIVNEISEEAKNQIEEEAKERFEKKLNNLLGEKITQTYDEMLGEEVRITDRWGDVKEKGTIRDLIKKRFDNAMNEEVDKNGKPSKYNSVGTRRQYLIDKRIKKVIDKKTKELTNHIDESINNKMKASLKEEIGEKLFKTLELEKFITKED